MKVQKMTNEEAQVRIAAREHMTIEQRMEKIAQAIVEADSKGQTRFVEDLKRALAACERAVKLMQTV